MPIAANNLPTDDAGCRDQEIIFQYVAGRPAGYLFDCRRKKKPANSRQMKNGNALMLRVSVYEDNLEINYRKRFLYFVII